MIEQALASCFTLPPRRPGRLGWALLTLRVARSVAIFPVLVVLAAIRIVFLAIEGGAFVVSGLLWVVVSLGVLCVFAMLFFKVAAFALS